MIALLRLLTIWLICLLGFSQPLFASDAPPAAISTLLTTLKFTQWEPVQRGLAKRRVVTPTGMVFTAFRISPGEFDISVVVADSPSGSTAQSVGESTGAMLVSNGGFFAMSENTGLYPVGYLRLAGAVHSNAWETEGGFVNFLPDGPVLSPSHSGVPANEFDTIQTRPMLIEPGGKWAMNRNSFEAKHRTVLCRLAGGQIILATFTRIGLSLYEAGWIFRSSEQGGFFGCDSAVAMDGGRSTQLWYSEDQDYSQTGLTPVQNFLVISERRED